MECGYSAVDLRKARHTAAEFRALTDRVEYLEAQLHRIQNSESLPEIQALPPLDEENNFLNHLINDSPDEADNNNNTNQDLVLHSDVTSSYGFDLTFDTVVDVNDFNLQNLDDIYLDWIGTTFPPYAGILLDDHQEESSSLALNALATNIAKLQINVQSGETFYVGPTSNRHLIQRPSESPLASRLVPSPPIHADIDTEVTLELSDKQKCFLLRIFLEKIQPILPIFDDDAFPSQPQELPPILRYAVLTIAAYVAGSGYSDELGADSRDIVTLYKRKFTYILGAEIEQCRLDNIKAFVLRTYLAVLQGHLESSNMFLSIERTFSLFLGFDAYL